MAEPDPSQGTRRFVSPEEMLVGRGAIERVGQAAAERGSQALVVATGGVFDRYGDRLLTSLEDAGVGATVYDEVRPDPTIANVEAAHDRYREAGCDCVVTLGGGSPIDTGKAVGVLAAHGGSIRLVLGSVLGYDVVDSILRIDQDNCALNEVRASEPRVVRRNDTGHLPDSLVDDSETVA